MEQKEKIIFNCKKLLQAYRQGQLGYMKMPEDSNPNFSDEEKEIRLVYFTLPMSLNYQRDSYKLWESVLNTFNDSETKMIFDVNASANLDEEKLRNFLLRYKIVGRCNLGLLPFYIFFFYKNFRMIFDPLFFFFFV